MPEPTRLPIFAYVNAEKAPVYRSVMRAFMDGRERYALHLRPAEILDELRRSTKIALDLVDVQAVLAQLTEWGNLEAQPDTAEVRTVAEFNRPRFLYRLTPEGDAAERALRFFEDNLEQPGELQITALGDIDDLLAEVEELLKQAQADPGKAFRTLTTLFQRLRDLTDRAQAFLAGLQDTAALRSLTVEAFTEYKDRLLEYLERFLGQLVVRQFEIHQRIDRLPKDGIRDLLRQAADREIADRLEVTEAERAENRLLWKRHWEGLRRWFVPSEDGPAQADDLRAHARAAIPAFLQAVNAINERHSARTDRRTELRTLASWFAEAPSDEDAHRLWRAAFGLMPPRHLRIDGETLRLWDEAPNLSSRTPWREAPPLYIPLKLRQTGRHKRGGRPANVVDFSEEKKQIARLAEREAKEIAEAQRRLETDGRIRLSEMRLLISTEFQLFLDLLGEALASQPHPTEPVTIDSSDGNLVVSLAPTDDGGLATIETSEGTLSGTDRWITIRPVVERAPADARDNERTAEVTVG